MKSRLAVSVLFTLIAVSFTSDTIGTVEKLRLWTGRLSDRYFMQVCNGVTVSNFAPPSTLKTADEHTGNQRRALGAIGSAGNTITLNSVEATRILRSHERCLQDVILKFGSSNHRSESFMFIRTAARQIHEVVELMYIK
jgi:hypothetical protein